MSLIRPLDEWPLLICGPMLRRVTPTTVSVFVVTSKPCVVSVVVRAGGQTVASGAPVGTRTIGALLHVALVTAVADGSPLTPEIVYAYDVRMTPVAPNAGPTVGLADQPGLLTGPRPLGYRPGQLPTFALAPGRQHLHVVHASCRKPHGGGPDAMVIVDTLIAAEHDNQWIGGTPDDARRRPHQLLLTGDQIYADDVAVCLLPALIDAGGLLLGEAVKERFPHNVLMTADEVKPGYARGTFLTATSELSSDAMENHLVYFAEFCAMYILAWSDELWARDGKGVPQLPDLNLDAFYPNREDPRFTRAVKARRGHAAKDQAEVLSYAGTVRRVRRALANVPTMMMFDDHEVSDDWNIDQRWVNSSRNNAATHRVVRNGLLAQAVFQAWGNVPERFAAGTGKSLLDLITVPPDQLASPLSLAPAAADVLLDIAPGGAAPAAGRVLWDWVLDGPEHRVIALDTRTHRDFVSAGPARPGLLTEAEMQRQLSSHRPDPGADPDRIVLVIAPAPVIGHPLVEEGLQRLMSSPDDGREADNEPWGVNRKGFESFLRRLAAFRRVILLSGDVHYGFTNQTSYFGAAPSTPARFVQLCSSAAKNADVKTHLIQVAGFLGMPGRGWFGFSTPITDDNGASLRAGLLAGAQARTFDQALRNQYFKLIIEERLDPPPVIPSGPWITDAATSQVSGIVALARQDDWAYQVTYLRDTRTGDQRLTEARVSASSALGPASRDLVRSAARTVVGGPNIGQVRFRMEQGHLQVVHRLHWMVPAPDLDPDTAFIAVTEHVAPLGAPGPADRPIVHKGFS